MWLSREEKEKQRQAEKLIDWELRKQLQWTALFVTTVLGLVSLLASNLIKEIWTPFLPIYVLLFLATDYAFLRMATSISVMRNYFESLPSGRMKFELIDAAQMSKLFDIFSTKRRSSRKNNKLEWYPRMLSIGISIIAGDVLLLIPLFF